MMDTLLHSQWLPAVGVALFLLLILMAWSYDWSPWDRG